MKYYAKIVDGVVKYLGRSKKVPKTCTEITKSAYDRYLEITNSIEDKEGYDTVVTLYEDFTYTVEYIPAETEE